MQVLFVALVALAVAAQVLSARPALAETPPVTLLAAGDIAYCKATWPEQLFRLMGGKKKFKRGASRTARLLDRLDGTIVVLGDLAYRDGSAEQFQNCYDPTWGRHKDRTFPVPGNHEYNSRKAKPYFAYWGPRAGRKKRGYYSFDLGAWHIIALNSNIKAGRRSKQMRWLRADLARTTARCILAYWHHPVFSSGGNGNLRKMRRAYRTLYEAGASVVLASHDHIYERFAPQDPAGRLDPERGIRSFVAQAHIVRGSLRLGLCHGEAPPQGRYRQRPLRRARYLDRGLEVAGLISAGVFPNQDSSSGPGWWGPWHDTPNGRATAYQVAPWTVSSGVLGCSWARRWPDRRCSILPKT
jgi:hypothetical protein